MLSFNPLRYFKKLMSDINIPFPVRPQPLEFWRALGIKDETIAELSRQWSAARHGPLGTFYVKLTNVWRKMEFLGTDPSIYEIGPSVHLRAEVTLVHPKRGMYQVSIALKRGENWSLERQNRQIASALKRDNPGLEGTSAIVNDSVVTASWYLTSYQTQAPG